MRYDTSLKLIGKEYETDDTGQRIKVKTPQTRRVFANRMSLSAAEFYEAEKAEKRLDAAFMIRACDYRYEERVLWTDPALRKEREYRVIRVNPKGEFVHLYCEVKRGAF